MAARTRAGRPGTRLASSGAGDGDGNGWALAGEINAGVVMGGKSGCFGN